MGHTPLTHAAAMATTLVYRLTSSGTVTVALPGGAISLTLTGEATLDLLLAEIDRSPRSRQPRPDVTVGETGLLDAHHRIEIGPVPVHFHLPMGDDDLVRERLRVAVRDLRSDPHRPIGQIRIVGPVERRTLLGFNPAPTPYSRRPIHEVICRQAATTPHAPAMRYGDTEWTYRRLLEDAALVAARLEHDGIGPGSVVALCTERSPEMVIAVLATLLAGAAYLPLDPSHPVARLDTMLEAAAADLVLASSEGLPLFSARSGPPVRALSGAKVTAEAGDPSPVEWRGYRAPADVVDGLCYVIFTSGSTGQPKGVQMTHASLANRLAWMQDEYRLAAEDVVLHKTPYTFDVSVWELLWAFSAGACLVVAPPEAHRDPEGVCEIVIRERVTVIHFVPSMLAAFIAEPRAPRCASLRLVVCSGEALPPKVVNRLTAMLADVDVHNLYGPTEAAIDVTAWRCRRPEPDSGVPIGRPIANVTAYVLDCNGDLAPIGVPGELVVGGQCLAAGYAARPDLTAERFTRTTVAGHAERVYRTGDWVWWSREGVLHYGGRIDTQVKIRGQRVELGEIESALCRHPAIANSVVLLREDLGTTPVLVAYAVLEAGVAVPQERELSAFLARCLPDYMIPRRFVPMAELPTTANGKADRRALPPPPPRARARRAQAEAVQAAPSDTA